MKTQIQTGGLLFVLVFSVISCASVPAMKTKRLGLIDRFKKFEEVSSLKEVQGDFPLSPKRELATAEQQERQERRLRQVTAHWRWPLRDVEVTSTFGTRLGSQGSQFHEGVDLRAVSGTAVYSVAKGTVIYADSKIGGYGKLIVIRHSGGLSSVYAHNSKVLVRRGQRVRQGQKIALSGSSGKTAGAHLHFELRAGTHPVNPVRVLPGSEQRQQVREKTLVKR